MSRSAASARKRNVKWTVILVMYLALGTFAFRHVNVTRTPSLQTRVFFLNFNVDGVRIVRGSYIVCRLPDTGYLGNIGSPIVTKRVECTSGQHLKTEGRNFYCDGLYLGTGKKQALNGKKAGIFAFNGNVPDEALFVMGDHPDSFDSRYFGFVRRADVKALAYPLF